MNTTTVNIKYMPGKVGFLIRKNNLNDFIEAVGINTMLWGGMYNLIIPYDNDQYTKEIGDQYAVDYYHTINSDDGMKGFVKANPHMHSDVLEEDIFRDYHKKFALIDVANFYNDFDPKSLNGAIPTIFNWNRKELDLLQKVLLGFYPQSTDLDIDFKELFKSRFTVAPTEVSSKIKSIGVYHDFFTPMKSWAFRAPLSEIAN